MNSGVARGSQGLLSEGLPKVRDRLDNFLPDLLQRKRPDPEIHSRPRRCPRL